MKFSQTLMLLGIVGKKGNGTLDNGDKWETDRVELHVLSDFDASDSMSQGQTVQMYKVDDFNANYDKSKALIGQEIIVDFEMVAAKKLGSPSRMVVRGFGPAKVTQGK